MEAETQDPTAAQRTNLPPYKVGKKEEDHRSTRARTDEAGCEEAEYPRCSSYFPSRFNLWTRANECGGNFSLTGMGAIRNRAASCLPQNRGRSRVEAC